MKTIKKQNKRISLLLLSLFSIIRADSGVDESDVPAVFARNTEDDKTEESKESTGSTSVKKKDKKGKKDKKDKKEDLKEKFPKKEVKIISVKEMKSIRPKEAYLELVELITEAWNRKSLYDAAKAELQRLESSSVKTEYDEHKNKKESLPLAIGRKYGWLAKTLKFGWFVSAEDKKDFHCMVDELKLSEKYVEKHDKKVKYLNEAIKFYETTYDKLLDSVFELVNKTDKKSPKDAGVEGEEEIARCQAAFDLADYEYRASKKITDDIKPSIDEKIKDLERIDSLRQ